MTHMFEFPSALQLLQQIADAQKTTFIVKDLEHRYVLVNQVFADLVGRSVADIIGKDDLEIGIPANMVFGDPSTGFPGFRALDIAALTIANGQAEHEPSIAYQAGEVHDASTLRTPLFNSAGVNTGLLVQSHDVTELSMLKTSLQQQRHDLVTLSKEMSALDSVVELLMSCHELVPLLQQVSDIVVERSMADMAFVMIMNESGEFLEVVAATAAEKHAPIGRTHALNEGVASIVWEHGKTTFLRDSTEGATNLFDWPPGTQRCGLPITVDGTMAGVLVVASSATSDDLEGGVALLERLGSLASIAMANSKLLARISTELYRSEALSELGQLLQQDLDPASAIETACRLLYHAVDAEWVASFTPVGQGGLQLQTHRSTISDDQRAEPDSVETWRASIALSATLAGQSVYQWCLDNDQSAAWSGHSDDARESQEVCDWREASNLGPMACRAIRHQDQPVGVVAIHRKRGQRAFGSSERLAFRVITDQLSAAIERHELSRALHHQAHHDSLTDLPNRQLFDTELHRLIEESENEGWNGALLLLDLDGFKYVNDTFGHTLGDKLLVEAAGRLQRSILPDGILARIGGDEFAVILRHVSSRGDATRVAQQLQDTLRADISIDGRLLRIGASIGLCLFPEDGRLAEDLLRNADLAMYQAKSMGKSRVIHFDNHLALETRQRARLEAQLRSGIEANELRLFYQPQICARSGRVDGVEALVRWQHPERGLLSPQYFIPLAEETGMINTLGQWVLNEGVRQLSLWQGGELGDLRVGINIAAPHFQVGDFVDHVRAAVELHGSSADKLELEVTESVAMSDVATVVQRFEALRALGVRIAIDDFGTGYSSLSCLQSLPLDVLKIDRSFTLALLDERNTDALIKAILTLADAIGLECIAEGIETQEQFHRLKALGCQRAQGFLFARAVPEMELIDTVRTIHRQTGYASDSSARAA